MTRKRLIKRLMGLGLSRNQANYMAARYRRLGMPYIVGYVDLTLGFCSRSMEEHLKNMCWLKEQVEKETGKKYRTFMEMATAMLRLSKEEIYEFCN